MTYLISEQCNGCGACVKLCPVGAIGGAKAKRHSVDEALCIECGVCGKICPQGALWDPFGVNCIPSKRSLWLRPICFVEKCTSCGICISACPSGALRLSGEEGSLNKRRLPLLEAKKCIACGFCAAECPFEAKWMAQVG